MQIPTVREGDILLYWKVDPEYWVSERAIQTAGVLEYGIRDHEYYHVAVAVDSQTKIEAIGGHPVALKHLVNDGTFDIIRPPWSLESTRRGLSAIRADIGQQYDMWLNIDDGLRTLSGGRLHLPDAFIRARERKAKNCISLLRVYVKGADSPIKLPINATPEDVGMAFDEYIVD